MKTSNRKTKRPRMKGNLVFRVTKEDTANVNQHIPSNVKSGSKTKQPLTFKRSN